MSSWNRESLGKRMLRGTAKTLFPHTYNFVASTSERLKNFGRANPPERHISTRRLEAELDRRTDGGRLPRRERR
jgi:hypothetical protein